MTTHCQPKFPPILALYLIAVAAMAGVILTRLQGPMTPVQNTAYGEISTAAVD